MLYRNVSFGLAVAVALGSATVAQAAPPAGSYQQSCNNVSFNGSILTASCRAINGSWQTTSLATAGCQAGPSNNNGHLVCSGGVVQGSYLASCRSVSFDGVRISASCSGNGVFQATTLDDYPQCSGDVANIYGKLSCARGGTPPAGSYGATCANPTLSGGTLTASCMNGRGGWVTSSLAYTSCSGDIWNGYGTLRCETKAPPTTTPPPQSTCTVSQYVTVTGCYNVDGSPSQYYTPGSTTVWGCGTSGDQALNNAILVLQYYYGGYYTAAPMAGACTYSAQQYSGCYCQ